MAARRADQVPEQPQQLPAAELVVTILSHQYGLDKLKDSEDIVGRLDEPEDRVAFVAARVCAFFFEYMKWSNRQALAAVHAHINLLSRLLLEHVPEEDNDKPQYRTIRQIARDTVPYPGETTEQ